MSEPPLVQPSESSAFAPDGTDLTLIRWMLSLTPTERLDVLQAHVDAIEAVRAENPHWTSDRS
jgi:hypothetical protein